MSINRTLISNTSKTLNRLPLPEQHRIVAKVDQLMTLVDAMEQQITSATHKQTILLEALLKGV